MSEEVTIDFLNVDGMKIIQRNDYFNFSIDSVLVANFLTINRNSKKIADLGTGNGAIPMLLSKRTKAKLVGLELQDVSVELANKNIILNKLEEQIEIKKGDIRKIENHFSAQEFDSVICNPPFFKLDGNSEQLNNLDQLTIARHEVTVNLEEIVKGASYILKNRGYFCIVHRASRFFEILEYMKKYNIQGKRVQFGHTKKDKEAKIVLIEGMKNSKEEIRILPPLVINNEDGTYSEEVLKMFEMKYRR